MNEERLNKLNKLAFTELRVVGFIKGYERVFSRRLVMAMTANEELKNLGYTLTPSGIRMLANSNNVINTKEFINNIRDWVGNVDAKPMYPDFPTDVMELDEAQYRMHQLLHYFSTYGIEWLTGDPVLSGWVPNSKDTEKLEDDTTLLDAKVIELVYEDTLANVCYERIVSKRERMTDKEKELVKLALERMQPSDLIRINIPFKQNMLYTCNAIFDMDSDKMDRITKIQSLKAICKHTGDVWKVLDYILTRHKFHLKTSQKRMLVQLLESYSNEDFKSNLIITNKKAERVILMLKYLDYNEYSRSPMDKLVVKLFRKGELSSWESFAKKLVERKDDNALNEIARRPGIMLRWLTYLLRNGYNEEDIANKLCPNADELSTQTLVTILTKFGLPKEGRDEEEAKKVMRICRKALDDKLYRTSIDSIAGKKVYVDDTKFNLYSSELHANDKSAEGGYVRSGLAYKIPDNVERLRFFTYWNDEKRVDIDLHAYALYEDGSSCHIGWNADFRREGLVTSGDMTTSDSAEYIDISFSDKSVKKLKAIAPTINLFNHEDIGTFKDIETCFVGMQAVDMIGQEVKLYNPKNCFFTHYLTTENKSLTYGIIDLTTRSLIFLGDPKMDRAKSIFSCGEYRTSKFSLGEYIDRLLYSQNCECVKTREEADVVLVMEKPMEENEISLIDNNFFMDL